MANPQYGVRYQVIGQGRVTTLLRAVLSGPVPQWLAAHSGVSAGHGCGLPVHDVDAGRRSPSRSVDGSLPALSRAPTVSPIKG